MTDVTRDCDQADAELSAADEQLLDKAGFRLERVIPTMADVSILEAVPG